MREAMVILGLLAAGCGAEEAADELARAKLGESGLVRFEVTPEGELAAGPIAFDLALTAVESGEPLLGAEVRVEVYMPGHGHSMPDGQVAERGGGHYRVHDCRFDHVGAYEVRYEVRAGEIEDTASFAYDVR